MTISRVRFCAVGVLGAIALGYVIGTAVRLLLANFEREEGSKLRGPVKRSQGPEY